MVAERVTGRTGLVVAVIGGPSQPDDVEPFLRDYFSDRRLFPPSLLARPLHRRRVEGRTKKNAPAYHEACSLVSLDSAMLRVCSAQANGIGKRNGAEGYVSLRHGAPGPRDTAELMFQEGMSSAVVIPGEPWPAMVESIGAVEAFVDAWKRVYGDDSGLTVIDPWHDDERWLEVAAMTLRETLSLMRSEDHHVLFLGPACLDRDWKLDEAFSEAARRVAGAAGAKRWSQAWTPLLIDESERLPAARDEVVRLAKEGVRDLVVYSLGHVSDRLETLFPIDIGLGRIARENGMRTFRVPSLNDREELLDALADMVSERVGADRSPA